MIGQPLTLAAARRLASDLGRERARGKDVVADRKAAKARKRFQDRERAANTFGQAATDFVELHAKAKTRRWQVRLRGCSVSRQTARLIRGSLADRWADRPVAEINGHDVYAVTEEAAQRGVPGWGARTDGPSESRARALFSDPVDDVHLAAPPPARRAEPVRGRPPARSGRRRATAS